MSITLRALLVTLCIAISVPINGSTIPDRLIIDYQLLLEETVIAKVQKTLLRDGGQYQSTSLVEPTGVGSLLADGTFREESRFRIEGDNLRPLRYSEIREDNSPNQVDIVFDWERRRIDFSDGRSLAIPRHEVQDNGSFLVALMVRPTAKLAGQHVNVVGGKGIRQYRYEKPVEEFIETPLGRLRTWRVEKRRLDRDNRTITVWLARDLANLPVKVVKDRNGKTTTLIIAAVEGLDSPPGSEVLEKTGD